MFRTVCTGFNNGKVEKIQPTYDTYLMLKVILLLFNNLKGESAIASIEEIIREFILQECKILECVGDVEQHTTYIQWVIFDKYILDIKAIHNSKPWQKSVTKGVVGIKESGYTTSMKYPHTISLTLTLLFLSLVKFLIGELKRS